jgi:hypothetical protein
MRAGVGPSARRSKIDIVSIFCFAAFLTERSLEIDILSKSKKSETSGLTHTRPN